MYLTASLDFVSSGPCPLDDPALFESACVHVVHGLLLLRVGGQPRYALILVSSDEYRGDVRDLPYQS